MVQIKLCMVFCVSGFADNTINFLRPVGHPCKKYYIDSMRGLFFLKKYFQIHLSLLLNLIGLFLSIPIFKDLPAITFSIFPESKTNGSFYLIK